MAVEERQKQGADMGAVDVGVGHDDDFVIAEFRKLKFSVPIPQPRAETIVPTSVFCKIFSRRAFSTFRILPRIGRIAWNLRSRPILAEPPAESPSTM